MYKCYVPDKLNTLLLYKFWSGQIRTDVWMQAHTQKTKIVTTMSRKRALQ